MERWIWAPKFHYLLNMDVFGTMGTQNVQRPPTGLARFGSFVRPRSSMELEGDFEKLRRWEGEFLHVQNPAFAYFFATYIN